MHPRLSGCRLAGKDLPSPGRRGCKILLDGGETCRDGVPASDKDIMTGGELELTKKAVEELLKPFAELIKRFAGPLADETGNVFGDLVGATVGDRLREYRVKRHIEFCKKLKGMIEEGNVEQRIV